MQFRFAFIRCLLVLLSGCGSGMCLNQAGCPDGSWSLFSVLASMVHRDRAAVQMTLKQEVEGAMPAGNRKVPDITKDDDGFTGGSVTFAPRPTQVCGTTQDTVEARVMHCALQNTVLASWNGSVSANAGQGLWRLVTYNGTHEVWRDERTNLLWSDHLGETNWCRAAGSSGGGPNGQFDPYNYCNNLLYQDQITPESWCTEDAGFNTPGAYDSMKAGMRLAATGTSPSVVWRLPTLWDYHQAEVDGIRFVLPNIPTGIFAYVWSASVFSRDREQAWSFDAEDSYFTSGSRANDRSVRCVGH